MKLEAFEDTWRDIILKAIRGQQVDIASLKELSPLEKASLLSLIEKGIFHKKALLLLAPLLHLHPQKLLQIALHPHQQNIPALSPNFNRFTTSYHGMQVNSYLVWSEENKKAIAFDTGADLTPLLKTLTRHHLQLSAVFLTHGHGDHIAQRQELRRLTGATAWIDQHDLVADTHPFPPHYYYQLDSTTSIEARPTPGHSPGGTTFVIHGISPLIAIVGDALFAGSVGGIPPSSYHAALEAIRKNILSLSDDTIIAPGHGPLTTVGEEKRNNPFFHSLQ